MSLSYQKLKSHPRTFLKISGLSIEEFDRLVARLHIPFAEEESKKKPYGRRNPLPTLEDKLLYTLVIKKNGTPTSKKGRTLTEEKLIEILVDVNQTGSIRSVSKTHKGRVHDFAIHKAEKLLAKNSFKLAHSGYQGLQKLQSKVILPYKKSKKNPLGKEEKLHNNYLSSFRMKVEHKTREIKLLKITSEDVVHPASIRFAEGGRRLMARILVISLFLQNCGGFRHAMSPGEKGGTGVTHTVDAQPLIGHEFMADRGNLVTFSQQNGQLQADVRVDVTQKDPNYRNLPVKVASDIDLTNLSGLPQKEHQRLIHLNLPKLGQLGSVSIMKNGLLGGMIREDEGEDMIPDECFCPITQEIMEDPVIAQDGHSYERSAIVHWLSLGHRTSPKTGARLLNTELTPNHTMRSLIQDLKEQMPVLARHKLDMCTIESAVKLREEEIQHVLELKGNLLQQAEQKVADLEKQLKTLQLKQQEFDEVVLVFGHRGVGKSAICNTILQKDIFNSTIDNNNPAIADDQQAYIADKKLYIEIGTTGLLDNHRKWDKTVTTIEKVLQYSKNHKIVFVISLETGRLQPADLVVPTTVCNTIKAPFRYGIILNKATQTTIEEITKNGVASYLHPLSQKTYASILLNNEEQVENPIEIGFSLSSENRHKLMTFFDKLDQRPNLQQETEIPLMAYKWGSSDSSLEKERLEKERLEQEEMAQRIESQLERENYYYKHAIKNNINWDHQPFPAGFSTYSKLKQAEIVAGYYRKLLYDKSYKYGGCILLARTCYKRNGFAKMLSPEAMGFIKIEPKSFPDPAYDNQLIRYLRDGLLILESCTLHTNSPFHARIVLKNPTDKDISFNITKGQIIEQTRFLDRQNLGITGVFIKGSTGREFVANGGYQIKPLDDHVFIIKANSIQEINVKCQCIDPTLGVPRGENGNLTAYADPQVRDLQDLAQNVIVKKSEETQNPKEICEDLIKAAYE
eukprot:gene119-164_t